MNLIYFIQASNTMISVLMLNILLPSCRTSHSLHIKQPHNLNNSIAFTYYATYIFTINFLSYPSLILNALRHWWTFHTQQNFIVALFSCNEDILIYDPTPTPLSTSSKSLYCMKGTFWVSLMLSNKYSTGEKIGYNFGSFSVV